VCAERDEAEAQATTALEATKDAEDDAKQSRLVAENALRKAEEAEVMDITPRFCFESWQKRLYTYT